MEEWIKNLKEHLQVAVHPLPVDDWDVLDTKYNSYISRVRRRRVFAITTATVAAIFLLLLVPTKELSERQQNLSSSLITENRLIKEISVASHDSISSNTLIKTPTLSASPTRHKTFSVKEEITRKEEEVNEEEVIPVNQPEGERTSIKEEININPIWTINQDKEARTRARIVISPSIHGVFSFAAKNQTGKSSIVPKTGVDGAYDPINKANHYNPWTVGLGLSIRFSPKIALTTGLELSGYQSTLSFSSDKTTTHQKAFYLGVPLKLDWYVWQSGRFSTWAGIGGKVDRCVFARVNNNMAKDNLFHWTIMAETGIQYALTDHIGLFIEPEISWYFKPEYPALSTYRTEHPLMFMVNTGLRFNF